MTSLASATWLPPIGDVLQYGALGLLLLVLVGLYRLGHGAVGVLRDFLAGIRADAKSELVELVGEIRRIGDQLGKQAAHAERRHGLVVAHVSREIRTQLVAERAVTAKLLEAASREVVLRVQRRDSGPISIPVPPAPQTVVAEDPGE